jgi:hypothetical protein
MKKRGAEVLLRKEVRCAAQEWIRNYRGEHPLKALTRALAQWISQQPGEQWPLAVALASMLWRKVFCIQSGELDLPEAEASSLHHPTQTRQGTREQHRPPPRSQQDKMAQVYILMRPLLAELRRWLPTQCAEPICGTSSSSPPTEEILIKLKPANEALKLLARAHGKRRASQRDTVGISGALQHNQT